MLKKYFVIVEKDKKSCYGVYSPDFQTVIGAGDTFAEAIENMRKNMEIYLEEVDSVPADADIETIEQFVIENYPPESVKTVVELEVQLPVKNSVRVNISIPDDTLRRMDARLAGRKKQRSAFITRAVEKALQDV